LERNPIDFSKVDDSEVRRAKAVIKRAIDQKGAVSRRPLTRKHFLCGCLEFTDRLPEEHLIVGYGYRYGNTTDVERVHHVGGEDRRVAIPDYVRADIKRHHFHRSDAEVTIFHNHRARMVLYSESPTSRLHFFANSADKVKCFFIWVRADLLNSSCFHQCFHSCGN
jgi:hypothetical protein